MASRIRNGLIGLLVLLSAGLLPDLASAATLYISEFASPASQVGTVQAQVYPQPALTDQTVAVTAGSLQSAAFGVNTHAIMVECDSDCSVVIGSNPTATTTNFLMGDGIPYQFAVVPGQKIAVIANGSGGAGSDVNLVGVGGAPIALGQTTAAGSLPVTIASNQTAVPVSPQAIATGGATYTHIVAGQATTTVKSGAGTLYAIILNTKATATNVTTIYDSTTATGTVIGIPDAVGATSDTSINYGPVGLAFGTGLTINTATANGADMTVVWK